MIALDVHGSRADAVIAPDPGRRAGWPLLGTLAILDPDLAVHAVRGSGIALELARETGAELDPAVAWGFLLRDLGTVDIPARILRKPGPLTAAEQGVVSGHTIRSAQLLDEIPELADAVIAARHHHERWDGSGYPGHLRGEEIPLECRVLAIADAYAALTAPRPHRPLRSSSDALAVITEQAGSQFDPSLAITFARIVGTLPLSLAAHVPVESLATGSRLLTLAHRGDDLSRGQLEALFSVALGISPEEAAYRCGRSLGTHRNWVSSLRRSLNCTTRQPLQQFLARLGRSLHDELSS